MKEHRYYVYILTNKAYGVFYVGMTNDLERRIHEHKTEMIEGFTKKYRLKMLVYFEEHQYVDQAIYREKRIKHWPREFKINMIQAMNPEWKDLAEEWFEKTKRRSPHKAGMTKGE